MSAVTPLGKYDDTLITRGKRSRTIAAIVADAQTSSTVLFWMANIEIILLIMHWWFAMAAMPWTVTPVIPDDPEGVTPAVLDTQTSAAFICINMFSLVWLAPITLYIALIFWRNIQSVIPTINLIGQLIAVVALVISLGYAINLATLANKADSGPNVMNDPFYCCVFWNSTAAGCLNYGRRCGDDLAASQLHISTGGAVHIALSVIMLALIVGINLAYVHTTFVGTHYDLISAESGQFGTKPNLQVKRIGRGLVNKIGKRHASAKPKTEDDSESVPSSSTQFVVPMGDSSSK
jgi:hypothetical protein